MGQPAQAPEQAQIQYVPISASANYDNRSTTQQSGADSDSTSASTSNNENNSSQSNVQINNNSNRIEFGNGAVAIPETTLSINAYGNANDFGAVITLNVPIGGKARKSGNAYAKAIAQRQTIAAQADLLTTCAKIAESGVVVDYSQPDFRALQSCKYIKVKTMRQQAAQTSTKVTDSEIELQRLRLEILKLQAQIRAQAQPPKVNTPVKASW